MKKEELKIGTGRIEAFSDAIIAIIMTLMILEIRLPKIENTATSSEIWHQLVSVLPNLFAYILSFAVLGSFWVNHHQFLNAVARSDRKLLWYNLHFLFWLSIIPLPTAFLAEHFQKPEASVIYGISMFMGGGSFGLMNAYAEKNELFIEKLSSKVRNRIIKINILSSSLYIISIFISYVSVYISIAIFAFVPTLYFIPQNVELGKTKTNKIEGRIKM